MRTLTIILLLLVVYATPGASQECSFGAVPCTGRQAQAVMTPPMRVSRRLICSNATSPCLGRHGAGCYNPAYATCSDGLVCTRLCSRVSDHRRAVL